MEKAEADRLFQQAVDDQQQGRLDEARAAYERILEKFPTYTHVPHLLGTIVGQRGDWYLARRLIESSLVTNAKDADALANLGWALFNLNLQELAVTRCDQALSLQPEHPRALFTRGLALHQLGRFAEAVEAYDKALALRAEMPEALNHRGRALHVLERYEQALASYERAIALLPAFADAWNNKGSALTMLQRHDEAREAFQQALRLEPRFPEALFNYGLSVQTAERLEDALEAYETALQLRPAYPEALLYRAHVLQRLRRMPQLALASLDRALALRPDYFEALQGRAALLGQLDQFQEALEAYDRVLAIKPTLALAHHERGHALRELGRLQEAAQSYREAIRLGGDARGGQFVLAAMGEGDAPEIAPQDFIVSLFDRYAPRFDDHLVNQLGYRAHESLCAAILKLQPQGELDIADLGCGTGLCGPLLAPIARHMVGVDLAPRMLEEAGKRGVYTQLVEADVASFLAKSQAGSFDALVSTDVFIYIGDLAEVFRGARHAIRTGGWFGFSIETADDQVDFVLRATRRYAQSLAYIRRLAKENGFEVVLEEPSVLRKERGEDAAGHIVVLRAT
jgi:predicted TPR repeat methyltransferase